MSILFYNIFLWLYKMGIRLLSPWNPKAKLWLTGRKGLLTRIIAINPGRKTNFIWMHCASLGEFEQGRPILERIRQQNPQNKVILTFFSPSGYEAKKYYDGADYIFYLPPDSKKNARLVIDAFNPKLVLWIKYEYWYYYLDALKKDNIPTLLISAIFHKEQPFFKWYGNLYRHMLDCFEKVFAQNNASLQLLNDIGYATRATLNGDTRFDRVVAIAQQFEHVPFIQSYCGDHQVIVAGSTWEEDEEELDHFANTHPEIKFIIAPHEIDESHLKGIEELFHRSVRYSMLNQESVNNEHSGANVLIIDNIGMLSRLYHYSTVSYLGGGFGDDGVHNVLEAAVYGKPVVYGPAVEKFAEAIELAESGGGIIINNALEAEKVFQNLLTDKVKYQDSCKAAKDYVYSNKGATERIMQYLQEKRLLTN